MLTQVSLTMPFWQLLAAHVLLMVSLAAVFTPVFTLGLGALPMHLYSHGSSMLGTLQQVAAAFGTALVVTLMSRAPCARRRGRRRRCDARRAPLAFLDRRRALRGGRAGAHAARPAAGAGAQPEPEPVEDLAA